MRRQTKRIVVVGGSFNPPTKAHQAIMKAAMQCISADTGIFVPSSDAYVRRKMSKSNRDNQVYSENERVQMLLCCADLHVDISTVEFGDDGKGHTYETLDKIQKENPDSEIWFVVGDDKLNIMTRWRNHDELLDRFRFVVLTRGATDVRSIIRNNKILNRYENHFRVCKSPKDIDNISSTECRKLINAKEWAKLKAYMDEKVIAYLKM